MKLFKRITCSVSFRELTRITFPKLELNTAYWLFFEYLLFGTFFDEATGRRVISQEVIASLEGTSANAKNYSALTFLRNFQTDVMNPETFQWSGYVRAEKARQITRCILPAEYITAYEAELKKINHDEGRLYFVDGSRFSRSKSRADRRERQESAVASIERTQCPEASEILTYLNGLPSNLFFKIREHIADALAVADKLENDKARAIQLALLKNIFEQPQPFYSPSRKGDTVRLFGVDGCITNLQRDVRRALTVDWHIADIKSSQLAICAALWKVAEIEQFLAAGGSIWDHLYEQMKIDDADRESVKPLLKKGLYSTCYGMKEPAIKGRLTKALRTNGIDRRGEQLTQSYLIRALLSGRGRAMECIRNAGGAVTCFGKPLVLEQLDERQILAQTAQAVELKLLHPIFQLANAHKDEFKIVLWLHDGFAVHFTRRIELWKNRISETVNTEIHKLGIQTYLEWE